MAITRITKQNILAELARDEDGFIRQEAMRKFSGKKSLFDIAKGESYYKKIAALGEKQKTIHEENKIRIFT